MAPNCRALLRACVVSALLVAPTARSHPGDAGAAPLPTVQQQQCVAAGWQREVVDIGGRPRVVLWKAPEVWTGGAIVVLHGGGGAASNFCAANVALIAPQVRFTRLALARGFAVFLPDSTDRVTDPRGRLCGKVWDDAAAGRDSLDLPFLEHLVSGLIPAQRPAGSRHAVFLTGLSSGGYMSVRAASRLGSRIAGFAPVSSGDPYGWERDCTPLPGDRPNVRGMAFDVDGGQPIGAPGACDDRGDAGERSWDDGSGRPRFRLFHDLDDGIHDASCVARVRRQLLARGYPETPPFTLGTGTARRALAHFWQDAYNQPLLDFFAGLPSP